MPARCRHCRRRRYLKARRLCYRCTSRPEVKALYPAKRVGNYRGAAAKKGTEQPAASAAWFVAALEALGLAAELVRSPHAAPFWMVRSGGFDVGSWVPFTGSLRVGGRVVRGVTDCAAAVALYAAWGRAG